jgi:hypothetical protein
VKPESKISENRASESFQFLTLRNQSDARCRKPDIDRLAKAEIYETISAFVRKSQRKEGRMTFKAM